MSHDHRECTWLSGGNIEVMVAQALLTLPGLVSAGGVVVLSGAGLSTESGIPDYRGPSGSLRRHSPMTYQACGGDPMARRRYWARSYVGWPRMAAARPNAGHGAVTRLQSAGLLRGVITQNVDGLHQAAGTRDVLELHGGLDRVRCLHCEARYPRRDVERGLAALNPDFRAEATAVNPDGDADLAEEHLDAFRVLPCPACGADGLKPAVVFFGETVPRDRVQRCFDLVDGARSLLVLGSSLTVMSGYRFVIRARRLAIPVAVVNQGPTRADPDVDVRLATPLGATLAGLAAELLGS